MQIKTVSLFGFDQTYSHHDVYGREARVINNVSPQAGRRWLAGLILGPAGTSQITLDALPPRQQPKPRMPVYGGRYYGRADIDISLLQKQIRVICGGYRFEVLSPGVRAVAANAWAEFKAKTVIGLLGLN